MKSKTILASVIALTLSGGAWAAAPEQQRGTAAGQQEQAEQQIRASEFFGWITGMNVRNLQDENIGSVDDLMIDPNQGRVTQAVLSVGGFLGIGQHLVAVPFEELQIGPDRDHVVVDATQEQLEAMPEFQYPDNGWGGTQ